MAVGYSYGGTCYPTGTDALDGFRLDFKNWDGVYVNSLTASSVAGTPPVITYTTASRTLDSDVAPVARTGTITLSQCDYSFIQQKDVPDILLISVLLFAAFMGLRTGFRP